MKFAYGKRTIVDGPFTETNEIIAGYWLIQEVVRGGVEWRRPNPIGPDADAEIGIRQLFDNADFEMSPEQRKKGLRRDDCKNAGNPSREVMI